MSRFLSGRTFPIVSFASPVLLILLISLSFATGQVQAQCGSLSAPSTTWNDGNGSWNVSGNWTSGTPNSSTNACILDGTSKVTLDTVESANGFQLASGNILNINVGAGLGLNDAGLNYGTLNNYGGIGSTALGLIGTFTNSGTLYDYGGLGFSTIINTSDAAYLNSYLNFNLLGEDTITNSSGAHLNNYGKITSYLNGQISNSSGAYLNNYGTIFLGDFSKTLSNSAGSFLTNFGTITMMDGAINNDGTLTNVGTIAILSFYPGLYNTGTINNSGTIGNSNFLINGGTLNNSGTIDNTSSGTGTGTAQFTNTGTINNSGTINNDGSLGNSDINYGQFGNSGTILNSGTINNGNYGHFFNSGTILNSGTINNSGLISNGGTFVNSGAVMISNSGLFTTSTNYLQTGGSTIVDGTLSATGGAIVDIHGGTLGGTGTINGNVLMAGTMMPGDAPGTLTIIGNYEQTSTGIFEEQMSPYSQAFLDVSGNVVLDPGAFLDIILLNGYNPLGQTISIMDFSTLSGQFANGSSFWDDNYLWDITYRQHEIDVTAVQAPEPSSFLFLAMGFLIIGAIAKCKIMAQ
jgi:hypothetical protein